MRSRLDHCHVMNALYSAHHTSSRALWDVTLSSYGREIIATENYEIWDGGFGRRQRLICSAGYDTVEVILKG